MMKTKMMKLLVFGLVGLALVSMPFLLASAAEKPNPSATPAPKPSKNVIEMKFGHWNNPKSLHQAQYDAFAQEVEARTNGGIHITFYPGGSLGDIKTHQALLVSGSIDFAEFVPMFHPGKYPLFDMFQLPWLTNDIMIHTRAMQELGKRGLLDKVYYEEAHHLAGGIGTTASIFTVKDKIRKPKDLEGIKIRSSGGPTTRMLTAARASVVSVPFTETYEALQRGVVAGAFTDWSGSYDAKFLDFLRHVCVLDCYVTTIGIVMNKKSYERLPTEYKKIIDEAADNSIPPLIKNIAVVTKKSQEFLLSKGGEIYNPTPAEMQAWKDTFMFVWEDWIKEMESKGLDGKALLHEYGQTAKRLGGEWPYKY
jgi:TRAP-type C4-dicarboxylate transport system substrate-binding protein